MSGKKEINFNNLFESDSDYDLRLAPPASRRIKLRAFDVAVEKRESREELNNYRSLFSASSLKSWSCYRCGKRYMWRDSLKKHLRIECGKDPTFECPICGRKFKHKHRWQSHARLIHYINMWPSYEVLGELWSNRYALAKNDVPDLFSCHVNPKTIAPMFLHFS